MELIDLSDANETFEFISGYYSLRSTMCIADMREILGFDCDRASEYDMTSLLRRSKKYAIGFKSDDHDEIVMFENPNNLSERDFVRHLLVTWGELNQEEIEHHVKEFIEIYEGE